jgi:hypothetical protein
MLKLAVATLLLLGAMGCASLGGGGGHDPVGEVHLFGMPVALRPGGRAAPDGIGVTIYASEPGGTRGIIIQKGALDVLMYDGPVAESDLNSAKPLKIWTFDAGQLRGLTGTTFLGEGYQLALKWDQDRPKGKVVTVVARYRAAGRADLYSAPSTISVTGK